MKLSVALGLLVFVLVLVENVAAKDEAVKKGKKQDRQAGEAALNDVTIIEEDMLKLPTGGAKKGKQSRADLRKVMLAELTKVRDNAMEAGKDPMEEIRDFVVATKTNQLDKAKKYLEGKTVGKVEKRIVNNLEKRIEKIKEGQLPSDTKLTKWLVINTAAKLSHYQKRLENKEKAKKEGDKA